MFIPQSVQAQLELANIADVKRQIITPRYSRPIIKFKQDTVLGTYKMTEKTKTIKYNDAMNLAMYCNNVDIFQIDKTDIDIHKLYSLIIPSLINHRDGKVNITNGKLLNGAMGDSILNQKIVYYSWDRHGPDITKNFFDNAQRLVTNWLLINGFTVGLGDATTNEDIIKDIQSFCLIKQMEIDKLITEMENNPDTLDPNTFETNILSSLSASNGEITKKVYDNLKNNESDNNFYIMIESKAKGSQGNIGQIIGGLGQNVLDGKRIKKKVNNRTLPHFFQNDDRPLARGFIPNSYYHGLTPTEFFFHHVTAREGMIDTAVKTSDSGYLQRKLIKGMEDIMMAYDKTIRSGNNVLIQMIYGDNNINQTFYKEVEIKLINMSNTELIKMFSFDKSELDNLSKEFKLDNNKLTTWNDDLTTYMKFIRDDLRQIQMKARLNYITIHNLYQLPVNMARIIDDAKNVVINSKQERLNPLYVIHAINYILRPEITKVNILDKEYDTNSIKFKDQDRAKYLFKIALLEYLSPKRCIYEYKLTKIQFDQMIADIIISFGKACVEPGEMVGILTAQSLGETLTQMCNARETKIMLKIFNKKNNKTSIKKITIGEFIEDLYKKFPYRVINIPQFVDSTEFSLDNLTHEFYICGVNNDEKVNWNKISHLSRHPTNGNLVKIKTASGRTITTTKSHNFLKRTANDGIIAVSCENLKLKDRIPVSKLIKYQINNKTINIDDYELTLDNKFGWLFGAYLAEGSLNNNRIDISNISAEYYKNIYAIGEILNVEIRQRNYQGEYGPCITTSLNHKELATIIRNHFKCGSFNKVIPEFVHNANLDFVAGLLRGYFDGDGNISADRNIIRIGSRSETLIQDISVLLLYFGIFSSLYVETKTTNTIPFYCLGIPHKYAKTFLEKIGTDIKTKENDIKAIIEFSESEHQYSSEVIDKIPELGHIISRLGTKLKMPANSRTYGVWERRNMSIGRRTLKVYIDRFETKATELNIVSDPDIEYLKLILDGEVIWDQIIDIKEIDDPKEYVYDFTVPKNETFMVNEGIIVHNTLNSVSWDQQISYIDNNINHNVVKIGEMIDKLLEENSNKVSLIDNSTETEYLDISNLNYKVQSVDENGKMHWKLIEAVTKHLPGGNVIKIKTLTGRKVVATKAKSFLIRRDNKLIDIEGSKIKVGDRLPIQKNAPELDNYLDNLDLSIYLSKNQYIYSSEMQKAINYRDTCNNRKWYLEGIVNKKFITPFKRSDTLIDSTKRNPELLNSQIILPRQNCTCSTKITEFIKLDELCGFFFGAYLAEGSITHSQIIISNNDESYRKKIIEFANRYNIKYHIQTQNNKNFKGATSTDIRLHSTILTELIFKLCGKYSYAKFVPHFAYIANKNFVKGLLDGYFSGDGTVNKRDIYIIVSSSSEQLLIGISELLTRFSIICKLSQHIIKTNNIGTVNIKPVNTLSIRNNNVNIFAKEIGFTLIAKQEIAEQSYIKEWTTINGRNDIIPSVKIGDLNGDYRRCDLQKLYEETTNYEIKKLLKQTLNEDVYYDPIIEIVELPLEEITPSHAKVYDLTVADTRNFNMFGGLCMRDTFHSSGVGVKGMQGIPRFREILSYSKNIQTPYMVIRLIPEVRSNHTIAHKIEAYLKHTIFQNLVERMDIIYDPIAKDILTKDNINTSNIYYINSGNAGIENMPWLYKYKISRESMLENDITLMDIKTKFMKYWDGFINDSIANKKKIILSRVVNGCIMSNFDNSENPIIHIRLDINNPDNYTLIEIGQYMLNKISIKGVANIEMVDRVDKQKVIEYDEDKGIKQNSYEWVILTSGIDLNKIKTNKYIDFDSVYINDIYMAYLNYGIEAARNLILIESDRLYGGSGNALNITHVALLADIMTNTGNITSIDRHGINRLDTDPLSRASFEKTVEQLITASAFGEVDHMRSVSSRIMAGRCFKGGTGLCDILIDNELIENSEYNNQLNEVLNLKKDQIEINTAIESFNKLEINNDDIFIP